MVRKAKVAVKKPREVAEKKPRKPRDIRLTGYNLYMKQYMNSDLYKLHFPIAKDRFKKLANDWKKSDQEYKDEWNEQAHDMYYD